MKEKLSISMLPCNRSVSLFFYGGIVCSVLFKILEKVAPAITFLVLLLGGICNFVFMYFFAKGCKPLQKNLYSLFLQYASTNLLMCIIYPLFFKYFSFTTSLVVLSLALIYSLVVYILTTITLCKNFTGELGTLGRAMWLFPSILFIVLIGLIGLIVYKVGEYNQTFGTIIGILGFGSLVVVIIGFIEIPCRMLKMLNNGYTSNLTDEEFQNQLREMGYYRDSSLKSCSSSFKISNPLTSSFSKIHKEQSTAERGFYLKKPDVSKKMVIVTCSVFLGLLIAGGSAFFIYQHNKNEKAKKARIVYFDLSEEYFPGNEYDEPNMFITKGKFDGEHVDVLALFPVEDTEFTYQGVPLYKKLVIKSESGELPDLEITVDDLPDFANYGGIPYDDSLFFLTTIDGTYEKGKGIQTGVAIQMTGSYSGAALEAAKYYLKNGKWTKGEPAEFEEEVKIEEADNHNSVGSSINSTFRNQDDSNYSAPREKVVSSQPNSLGFRPGKNSFKADMIHTDERRFPFDLSLNYNPNGNPEITNAVYYNPSAGAKVELKVDVYNDGFMRLSGTSGGKAFILEFSGSNPYTGDAWWGDLHMDVEMSLK